jgi:hypothetical protein
MYSLGEGAQLLVVLARVDDDALRLARHQVAQHALAQVQVLVEQRRRAGGLTARSDRLGQVLRR